MNFQIFSTGQGKESRSFAWVFETGFHNAPETDASLAVILLLQLPKCLYSRHMPQCPVSSKCLQGATDDNKYAGQSL